MQVQFELKFPNFYLVPQTSLLSETYLTPSQTDKKTKVFVTPNRYAVLNTNENNIFATPSTSNKEDPDSSLQKDHNAEPQAPPIHIKNIFNFSAFNTVLKNITRPKWFYLQ